MNRSKEEKAMLLREEYAVYRKTIDYFNAFGYSPTLKELSGMTDISSARVRTLINELSAKNLLKRKKGIPRSIHIVGVTYNIREVEPR